MHANLELTNQCNQACVYCFNDSGLTRSSRVQRLDWRAVLEGLADANFRSAHLTGGEPFLAPNILDLIAFGAEKGLSMSVLSNGHAIERHLREDRARDILQRLSVAQISLDSMVPSTHDTRRGRRGAWDVAVGAIHALRNADIETEISCVVDEETIDAVPLVASFSASVGAKLILRPQINRGRARSNGRLQTYAIPAHSQDILKSLDLTFTSDRFHYLPDKISAPGFITLSPTGVIRGRFSRRSSTGNAQEMRERVTAVVARAAAEQ